MTEMHIAEIKGKRASWRIILETFEITINSNVPCHAKVLKSKVRAFEILGTLQLSDDLLNFSPVLFFHCFLSQDAELSDKESLSQFGDLTVRGSPAADT